MSPRPILHHPGDGGWSVSHQIFGKEVTTVTVTKISTSLYIVFYRGYQVASFASAPTTGQLFKLAQEMK